MAGMETNKKTIGIIGGMGSEATSDLFRSVVYQTQASSDGDHLPLIINNNTSIPDRSDFILGIGPDPVPFLIESARKLELWGADFLIMPCNTAHYFIEDIRKAVSIPLINMIDESAKRVEENHPEIQSLGLLSTLGVYKTRIYNKFFNERGLKIIFPDEQHRQNIMNAIYGNQGIKAGYKKEAARLVQPAVKQLLDMGARAIITGCTEIPLIMDYLDIPVPIINPTKILARKSIEMAGGMMKEGTGLGAQGKTKRGSER